MRTERNREGEREKAGAEIEAEAKISRAALGSTSTSHRPSCALFCDGWKPNVKVRDNTE